MQTRKRVKLAYKVIGTYLVSHMIIAMSILTIIGVSIKTIQEGFIEGYIHNAEQHMEYFDEELLNLRRLLVHMMQNESILVLSEQYEQLSDYNRIRWKKQAKDELMTLTSQYKWIKDMGIYIPEIDLWVTAVGWFKEDDQVKYLDEEKNIHLIDNTIYLTVPYEKKNKYRKSYIKLDAYEMKQFIKKMKFDEEVYIEALIDGELLEDESAGIEERVKRYRKITIKSSLYPIEINIYINNNPFNLGIYFYLFSCISLSLLIFITIRFAKYLNKAIHKPLHNVVRHIEGMNKDNFEAKIEHSGMDEFDYVTASFNKTKGLLEDCIKRNYEQEISMKQMELDYLQEQIKPHFLYNCFFNITNMCKTYDVEKIEQLTMGLAKYYRYITRTSYTFVRLEEEYNHMRNYIAIQEIRFEDRVRIEVEELPQDLRVIYVPRLILQPIVENAYKYVFEKIETGGYLRITIKQAGKSIKIQVEDNGHLMEEELYLLKERIQNCKEPITGLMNIKKRLQYTDERNKIVIEKSELGGMGIILEIYIAD